MTVGSSSMWPMSQANQMSYLHPTASSSSSMTATSNRSACIIPKVLEDAVKVYERFYATRHSGRRLNWHTELGNMEIRIKFKKSTHELSVSTFAGIVLLLFDGQDENRRLSYEVGPPILLELMSLLFSWESLCLLIFFFFFFQCVFRRFRQRR